MAIRMPVFAGSFYPDDARLLHSKVQQLLLDAPTINLTAELSDRPKISKAVIVPHAGYMYSGSTAATAFKSLLPQANAISRVILLGPSHRVPLLGIATPELDLGDNDFLTPLGKVPLDAAAIAEIIAIEGVVMANGAHAREHSLEVQLPFLQQVLGDFNLVPLVVGQCAPSMVAKVLDTLWGDGESLIIISSDLSHFHTYLQAQEIDRHTTGKIEALEFDLQAGEACGCYPLNGLLMLARHKGLEINTLTLCNSGDTAGNKNRVVGYGAYVLH
ncbi:MAG: AmmeMemoRadiSam system protein B [Oleispira sp.]|nr:AmmeMemoRadiSam system protein B [Oleispira sp.]